MTDDSNPGERIAKLLARAGVGSRREVERMIAAGRIKIDGRKLDSPALNVTGLEGVTVDGRPVAAPETTRLWRYHKPAGLLTSHSDPQGRPTVFERLPAHLPRVISVGRLDLSSEGLLLLTNDGELARRMELPSTGWTRRYKVRAYGRVREASLERLRAGPVVDGIAYAPIEVKIERAERSNVWLTVALTEGKNREIRRVLAAVGLEVNRLIRIGYGPFVLSSLPRGAVVEVPRKALLSAAGDLFAGGKDSGAGIRHRPDPSKWAKAKAKPKFRPGGDRRGRRPSRHTLAARPKRRP